MVDAPKVRSEARMLIDGTLVDAEAGTFTNVNPATEEIPGEVAGASTDRIATAGKYGLAGNVMSASLDRSLALARRIRAGLIGPNGTAGYGADTPFGGYEASGVGRQNGTAGFDQYTEIKSVAYPVD